MASYIAREESGVELAIEAETDADAIERARDWAADGDYGDVESTLWVDVRLSEVCPECAGRGRHTSECDSRPALLDERVTAQIEPRAPKCTESEHDWQSPLAIVGGIKENPGVWGHGGGVVINECCMHCGCARITDTWAQRRDTGEQGLTSVRYDREKYAEAFEARRAEEEDAA